MRFSLRGFSGTVAFTLVLRCAAAPAALVIYPDLRSFLVVTGPTALESFESLPELALGFHSPTRFNDFTITSDGRFGVLTTGPTVGQHPTDGTHYLGLAYDANPLLLSFANPIHALSLDIIDFGDVPFYLGQTLSMTTSAGDSMVINRTVADYDPPNGNVFFFSFSSDIPLTSVTFQTVIGDTMGIDAVRMSSVPEPLASLLLGWGISCLFARRRPANRCASRNASACALP
jgi:hypothetical protein